MTKSRKRRRAERIGDEVRDRTKKIPIETLAWVAGVSEDTVTRFRKGGAVRADSAEKIATAVEKIKEGLRMGDVPGPLALDSGKPWQGATTVKEMFGGRRCGWCGTYHGESLKCN